MDLFQTFKNQLDNQFDKNKEKKIYVVARRKSYNINDRKLNEILYNNQSPKKFSLKIQQNSVRIGLRTQSRNSKQNSQKKLEQQLMSSPKQQKNKLVRNKILTSFQPQRTFHERYKKQKQKKQNTINLKRYNSQSQQKRGSKQFSLYLKQCVISQKQKQQKIKQKSNQSPVFSNQKIQNQLVRQSKNSQYQNSLPYLNKNCISFQQAFQITSLKPKQSKKNITTYATDKKMNLISRNIESNRTTFNSMIIQNSTKEKDSQLPRQVKTQISKHSNLFKQKGFSQIKQKSRPTFDQQIDDLQIYNQRCKTQQKSVIDRYYSLIKNMNYQRMTNQVGKKYIRNYFIEKKNNKRHKKNIDEQGRFNLRGKDFIKIKQIFSLKKKQDISTGNILKKYMSANQV